MADSRRQFLGKLALAAGAGLLGAQSGRAAKAAPLPRWARLITPYGEWARHAEEDRELTQAILRLGGRVDEGEYWTHPAQLSDLLPYALIFTDNLAAVRDPQELRNLSEYLQRGGFLYVDGCNDLHVTPHFLPFYEAHIALFARLLPGSQTRLLAPAHPIFSTLEPVREQDLVRNPLGGDARWAGTRQSLWGVYDDDRLAILYSQEHLRCAWGGPLTELKQTLAANIHAYGMMG